MYVVRGRIRIRLVKNHRILTKKYEFHILKAISNPFVLVGIILPVVSSEFTTYLTRASSSICL